MVAETAFGNFHHFEFFVTRNPTVKIAGQEYRSNNLLLIDFGMRLEIPLHAQTIAQQPQDILFHGSSATLAQLRFGIQRLQISFKRFFDCQAVSQPRRIS